MSYSFKTRKGTAATATIPVSVNTSGYTLSVEFSPNKDFQTISTTKTPTGSGTDVTLSLTSTEVDAIKSAYYRVKAVKSGVTSYIQTGTVDYLSPLSTGSDLLGGDGKIKAELLPASTGESGERFAHYYIWKPLGGQVKAMARVGSGLPAIPDGSISSVLQAAVNNLTPLGNRGTGGGNIHIARPLGSDIYFLDNEITITGWEGNPGNTGVPESQLVISGEGGVALVQNTPGQNGFVVKNCAGVTIKNFYMYVGVNSKAGILGDDTGSISAMSFWKSRLENLHIMSASTTSPAIHVKNFFDLKADHIIAQNQNNHGILVENNSNETSFGNSHWGRITAAGSSSAPYAALAFRSSTPSQGIGLILIDHFESVSNSYYGLYTHGTANLKISFVDIESTKHNIWVADRCSKIWIEGGYLGTGDSTGHNIHVEAGAGNVRVSNVYCETIGGSTPLVDMNLYQPSSSYDISLFEDADINRIVFADPTRHSLRVSSVQGPGKTFLAGTITAPTPTSTDNSTKVATTEFVKTWAPSAPAAGTPGLRALGNTSTTAAPGNDIRFSILTSNTQTGTAYTLVLADARKVIEMNNAAANTVTIPTNATQAFSIGTVIDVVQIGAGITTIAPAAGVTLRSPAGLAIPFQYGSARLRKRATDEWVVENGSPAVATATARGIVELADNSETTTGTDATRAVTPAGLKAVTDTLAPKRPLVAFFVDSTLLYAWTDGYHYQAENPAPITVTVPNNSNQALPIGYQVDVGQGNVGEVSFAAEAGVNLQSRGGARKLAGRYAIATLRKVNTNEWWLFGDIAT